MYCDSLFKCGNLYNRFIIPAKFNLLSRTAVVQSHRRGISEVSNCRGPRNLCCWSLDVYLMSKKRLNSTCAESLCFTYVIPIVLLYRSHPIFVVAFTRLSSITEVTLLLWSLQELTAEMLPAVNNS